MSSSTDIGGQIITFGYQQEGTSENFNRHMWKTVPSGIISGGTLSKTENASKSVTISPMIVVFEDGLDIEDSTDHQVSVRIETTSDVVLENANINTPYVVAEYSWSNTTSNYMNIRWGNDSDVGVSHCMILGKCLFSDNDILTTFDLCRRDWSYTYYENINPSDEESKYYPSFKPYVYGSDKTIYIGKGKGVINGTVVDTSELTEEQRAFDYSPYVDFDTGELMRYDILCIDKSGSPVLVKGTATTSESDVPTFPQVTEGLLPIAKIKLPQSGVDIIRGDWIEYIYNNNVNMPQTKEIYVNGTTLYING